MNASPAVVTGAGPVGTTVALQLAKDGVPVRLLTRSGNGPEHPLIDRIRADVAAPGVLARHMDGARALFHCIHGSDYNAAVWRRELPGAEAIAMDAAAHAGVPVVFPESLYSYDLSAMPLTERTPRNASRGKYGVRTELLRARETHPAATVSVVASDFYGPHVRTSHAGERMVPRVLAGRKVSVLGRADVPHSFTFVPDLAAAMIAASADSGTWNTVLHAPTAAAPTQRGLAEAFASAAGVPAPKVGAIPAWALRGLGAAMPSVREIAEMMPQFTAPFVIDSAASESLLGLSPTPLEDGARATVEWWRTELARAAA